MESDESGGSGFGGEDPDSFITGSCSVETASDFPKIFSLRNKPFLVRWFRFSTKDLEFPLSASLGVDCSYFC